MNNIIFLDIDGVVCTLRSHFAYEDTSTLIQAWDPTCCNMVAKLCDYHFGTIVLSSTWRFAPEIDKYMEKYGLKKYMHRDWKTVNIKGGIHGKEIQEWIDRHREEVSNYVILDDDSDMLRSQKPHLILTDCHEGFGSKDYLRCKEILKHRMPIPEVPCKVSGCSLNLAGKQCVAGLNSDSCGSKAKEDTC